LLEACKEHFIQSVTPRVVKAYLGNHPAAQGSKARAGAREWASARWDIMINEGENR
jgi:hypothetical protein